MRLSACLLALVTLCTKLFAEDTFDEYSFPESIACENGNVLFSNVGNFTVSPCKWIRLSTNSTYMVVCQVAYENSAFQDGPSTPAEIMQARQAENCLNLALLKFLQGHYQGKSDAELVRSYRSGAVRAKVEDDFPLWFENNAVASLKQLHDRTAVDGITVQKVSMRAVGLFAEALQGL